MLQAGIPAEKCSVTYNTMWDFDSPKSPEQWRRDWNVSSEEILLGCVKIKGTDLLIKAVENLPKHLPWRLVVIGSIVDKTIAQAIESSPVRSRIITTGELKHAVSAMRAMDLFVMPSRSEGLGRALIEACSVGVCPVVSDAGGMKELVRNQIDGWVFQRGNVDQLTDALTQLIGNQSLRNNFAHSAQNNVSELCSPANVTDRLLAIYNQALQHRTRTPAAI
jgi:glycosyltransferase involved in cell wall biosynthesis